MSFLCIVGKVVLINSTYTYLHICRDIPGDMHASRLYSTVHGDSKESFQRISFKSPSASNRMLSVPSTFLFESNPFCSITLNILVFCFDGDLLGCGVWASNHPIVPPDSSSQPLLLSPSHCGQSAVPPSASFMTPVKG